MYPRQYKFKAFRDMTSTCVTECDLSEPLGSALETWEDVTAVGLTLLGNASGALMISRAKSYRVTK